MSTPFATRLSAAIDARGCSLSALARSLRHSGHSVTVATLSLWASGQATPRRQRSLNMLADLEQQLGLGHGELRTALGLQVPPTNHERGSMDDRLRRAAASAWGLPSDDGLAGQSLIGRCDLTVDEPTNRLRWMATLRATRAGADRLLVVSPTVSIDGRPASPVMPLQFCSTGRQRPNRDGTRIVTELVLPEPLPLDGLVSIEYGFAVAAEQRRHTVRTTRPMALVAAQVAFGPDAPLFVTCTVNRRQRDAATRPASACASTASWRRPSPPRCRKRLFSSTGDYLRSLCFSRARISMCTGEPMNPNSSRSRRSMKRT